MHAEIRDTLISQLDSDPGVQALLDSLGAQVAAGTRSPAGAAGEVLTELGLTFAEQPATGT